MSSKVEIRCRMTTRDGHQCSRDAVEGGMGFCWQHVPEKTEADREKWKKRIEGAALVVAASDLLLKIVEFAVEHCHELFGEGDEQSRAKHKIEKELKLGPRYPTDLTGISPGSRVDWKGLLELSREARASLQSPESANLARLEQGFDRWFQNLNKQHKEELLRAFDYADDD
jgi:hypothetical protein